MEKVTKREFNCKDVLWDILDTMSKDYNMSKEYLIEVALNEFAHSKGYLELAKNTDKKKVKKLEDSLLNNDSVKSNVKKFEIPKTKDKLDLPTPSINKEASDRLFEDSEEKSKPKRRKKTPPPPAPKSETKPKPEEPVNSEPKLMIEYGGELTEVNKNKFVIGRASQADLRITENPSISRKHALIVQKNGKFYIKDLGSINGTEYKGKKIDLRLIADGDVFSICDVPLLFKLKN